METNKNGGVMLEELKEKVNAVGEKILQIRGYL